MEVMVGSPYGVYIRGNRSSVLAQDKAVSADLFLATESGRGGLQIGIGLSNKSPEESSDSSSSIGESSENEEEEDDAVSCQRGALDSLSSSLEESLPIKRGLSNHYVGKSKSFGNLMEASNNAKNLEKVENPFNKRRRLLIANKLRSRERSLSVSNFHSWENRNSLPLLVLQEHGDDDYENKDGDQSLTLLERRTKKMIMMKNKKDLMAQTQSCFCLSSLQEEDDDDDGDDE